MNLMLKGRKLLFCAHQASLYLTTYTSWKAEGWSRSLAFCGHIFILMVLRTRRHWSFFQIRWTQTTSPCTILSFQTSDYSYFRNIILHMSARRSLALHRGKRSRTYLAGGRMGPRISLDDPEKKKMFSSGGYRTMIFEISSIINQSLYRLWYSGCTRNPIL
jgi:hypothetical protein